MNRKSIEIVKEIYKPTKITILGNVQILESTSGNIVIKEKKNNIRELYDYLESRSFCQFPQLIDDSREGINVFQYVKDFSMPKEQKAEDLIRVVGKLHQKTTYYREVSSDEYKKIYDEVKGQIDYLKYFYDNIYNEYFQRVFPSPSEYFLLTNISKILASLSFSEQELESWYQKVTTLNKYRVCQIHNNLSLDHLHKEKEDILLSWEKSRKDSPVIDLYSLYKNTYFDLHFEDLLEDYFQICPWSEEEKKLFFIVISIPPKFELKGSEFERVKNMREVLDYVYKTENLIRPYYAVEQKE